MVLPEPHTMKHFPPDENGVLVCRTSKARLLPQFNAATREVFLKEHEEIQSCIILETSIVCQWEVTKMPFVCSLELISTIKREKIQRKNPLL